MPADKRQLHSINLLPSQKLDDSTTGKVVKWLLSTFRIIVVLVQIVVIAAFAGRVFVDARLSVLNKEIEEKYALVQSYNNIEETFRVKKLKLETYQSLKTKENTYLALVDAVAGEIPSNVQLIAIEKNGPLLSIKARATQESAIYSFASRLNTVEGIQNAQVVEIRQNDSGELLSEFTIQATVPSLVNKVS
jgi:Tfp pilus assembly protein PilN